MISGSSKSTGKLSGHRNMLPTTDKDRPLKEVKLLSLPCSPQKRIVVDLKSLKSTKKLLAAGSS